MESPRDLTLASGAVLQYFIDDEAPAGADLLLYHHGTPAAGPLDPIMVAAARENGLKLVELVRPGYGGSTRQPGRTVSDVVPLVEALADALGHERFVALGWSGGGPHVVATAALLPHRCAAAVCLAGVAPFEAPGLNWLAGMGADNWQEFGAALVGPECLEHFLTEASGALAHVRGPEVVEAMASLLPEVDRQTLTGAVADHMAAELRWSVSTGFWGWYDDDVAFLAPWGIDLGGITVPIQVLQGTDDLMVPLAHGEWLGEAIPSATRTLLADEGHLSVATHLGTAFAGLRSALG